LRVTAGLHCLQTRKSESESPEDGDLGMESTRRLRWQSDPLVERRRTAWIEPIPRRLEQRGHPSNSLRLSTWARRDRWLCGRKGTALQRVGGWGDPPLKSPVQAYDGAEWR